MVKFGMQSLACCIISGMLEAGSGQDMTRSQASGADHTVPWEFGELRPSLGEAVGGFSARSLGLRTESSGRAVNSVWDGGGQRAWPLSLALKDAGAVPR